MKTTKGLCFFSSVLFFINTSFALREFRSYSTRHQCEVAQDPNYPFSYSKYEGQDFENKGRTNSNLQDFRHPCQVLGGRSKCHICEDIECSSELGSCFLQLQGVNRTEMSINIPTVSDTSWAVGGAFRHDYGGESVTHFCVFTSGGPCILPETTDYTACETRCFGYGFQNPARRARADVRTIVDQYPGMGRWPDDGQVDPWLYPRNCSELLEYDGQQCSYTGQNSRIPSYNPQGFSYTHAGSGEEGFLDGSPTAARFRFPQDVAVDGNGVVYVADTQNHAIRRIALDGTVSTIAGKGKAYPGYEDGDCSIATFSLPKGLDVRHKVTDLEDVVVIIVADTGNHRVRQIELGESSGTCIVSCLTGLCGNNTLSATDSVFQATPLTGYADGSGLEARFSAPESVAFMEGDVFVVADTGNFLIRWVVASTGETSTLAGSIIPGEKDPENPNVPLAGCTPPCLAGQQGFRDGNLTHAQFYNPLDVTRGPNNTVWVVDEHRVRIIELPENITTLYSIRSIGRVSTIAGNSLQGYDDGQGALSTFFVPSGIFVTPDNIAFVAEAASCKIRRVSPVPLVAEPMTCSSAAYSVLRPSGCTSFDQPVDKIGRKVSRVEANIQYNIGNPYEEKPDRGKYIKNCVGVPPRDRLDKRFVNVTGDNLVIDDLRVAINEDSEQGTAALLYCPALCDDAAVAAAVSSSPMVLEGTHWYSESSVVCLAAIHDSVIVGSMGGYIQITFQRRDFLNRAGFHHFINGSIQNGFQSGEIPDDAFRVFRIEPVNVSMSMVHTVAGHPSAPLESGCGFRDAEPPTLAYFDLPSGVAANYNYSLSDVHHLFIADTNNHRIRAISATCTQICENGGRCVGPDICSCATGWTGIDCAKPVCSSTPCSGANTVCVGPDTCACKPGFEGPNCDVAQCVQSCLNGGSCTSPDTCTCAAGWFDVNCTTPVCAQTCANGGNCTAPNTCACPSEWTGVDCRIPVCEQTCQNQGFCIAPNTCACPPQWSNYDCSAPVCHQGFFQPNGAGANVRNVTSLFAIEIPGSPTYKNCNHESWCNATNEFECDQLQMTYGIIRVPSGPEFRAITGRKVPPTQCMNIELPLRYKIPFELLRSDGTTTGDRRYAPFTPYTSDPRNAWRGYLEPTAGHTGPWVYENDRQVAQVNWLNVSQGLYVCANGGSCVEPGVCACAEGWVGFDCRTPVCTQGYYEAEQTAYVSGQETENELEIFSVFMGNNTYNLTWPYSNPNYTMQFEFYNSSNEVIREIRSFVGARYFGPENFTDGYQISFQGGYRCTIRAFTEWENEFFVFSHPNYYSRYMDSRRQADNITYTFWQNMEWPPLHRKSRVLDRFDFNVSYAFTNEGFRRQGIWNRTAHNWQFGLCIMEFDRNCSSDPTKELDLESNLLDVLVQDTDLAYRPRIFYNDFRVISSGRWNQAGGECVDEVVRGCYNNGTCVQPDVCSCATGWTGTNCQIPVCEQTCFHNGNCTGPNECTCERGWEGFDCLIPLCAQECQNGGICVAPDVCQCLQWSNTFRDGRLEGGRPLFQDENGDPLNSGWTGYDCSIPICVQAETFLLNVGGNSSDVVSILGGHGGDGLLECTDPDTGLTLPRCPQFDEYVTANDGRSFQTGCGFDPYDTGCCILGDNTDVTCYRCDETDVQTDNSTFFCRGNFEVFNEDENDLDSLRLAGFLDAFSNILICGKYHNPRYHDPLLATQDYGVPLYYVNVLNPQFSSFNFRSNLTSNRFLCNVEEWTQGDYVDDAGLGSIVGAGSVYGLTAGRHTRINTPNIQINGQTFTRGPILAGEGVYKCYNGGSCIGPDVCTCTDGFEGYDCRTPLCRHLQPSGKVTSCLNGGICASKDDCDCIQTGSVLWEVHADAERGLTGWTGSDCSIPMCVQGYYDPFCTDLPQAPAGQGCYRCSNGGNCTAPDICTCAEGWTGHDCRTPVCEVVADPLTRSQIGTVFEDKVIAFESDPCGLEAIYGIRGFKGRKYPRGNCTQPNQCTCLCKNAYNEDLCSRRGDGCSGPWQDNMVEVRDLLGTRGPQFLFGSSECQYGYEGNVDILDRWTTCHQTVFVPNDTEKDSLAIIISLSVIGFFAIIFYQYASARIRRRFLLAKIERRRSKRSSEESLTQAGAFVNN